MIENETEKELNLCVSSQFKVKNVLDDILEKLPEEFNMTEIMQTHPNRSPYALVCLQECERMNTLLREIRVSLQQLELGLKVSLIKAGLEQASPHENIFTLQSSSSLPGGADTVSWHGSPAVCAELRRGTRNLEQTGLSIHVRPGPVVSTHTLAWRWFGFLNYAS